MARDIGFAVIGLGMGMHHCRAIKDAPGARLLGFADAPEQHDVVHAASGREREAPRLRNRRNPGTPIAALKLEPRRENCSAGTAVRHL